MYVSEASIRAEIEAQLGLKRAEVRDRLNSLAEKMDSFREMAETKMRDAITSQIQGEIDSSEAELQSREEEFAELQQTDSRAEKRQKWMQSISGQAPASMPMGQDPSTLGARAPAMSGMTRTLGATESQGIGLGGMRAPMGGAKPLGQAPTLRPVKAPIGSAQPSAGLPKPIERQVRMPLQPKVVESTQELPAEEIVVPVGAVEVSIKPGEDGQFGTSDDEAIISKRDLSEVEQSMEEVVDDVIEAETETTTLRPVQGTLTPLNVVSKETEEGGDESETAMLRPVQRLTPLSTQQKEVKNGITNTCSPTNDSEEKSEVLHQVRRVVRNRLRMNRDWTIMRLFDNSKHRRYVMRTTAGIVLCLLLSSILFPVAPVSANLTDAGQTDSISEKVVAWEQLNDGKVLMVTGSGKLSVNTFESGKHAQVWGLELNVSANSATVDAGENLVAVAHESGVVVVQLAQQIITQYLNTSDPVNEVDWDNDGDIWLAYFAGERCAEEWSGGISTNTRTFAHNGGMTAMLVTPTGDILTGGYDNRVLVSSNNGALFQQLTDMNSAVNSLELDSQGRLLVGTAGGLSLPIQLDRLLI